MKTWNVAVQNSKGRRANVNRDTKNALHESLYSNILFTRSTSMRIAFVRKSVRCIQMNLFESFTFFLFTRFSQFLNAPHYKFFHSSRIWDLFFKWEFSDSILECEFAKNYLFGATQIWISRMELYAYRNASKELLSLSTQPFTLYVWDY